MDMRLHKQPHDRHSSNSAAEDSSLCGGRQADYGTHVACCILVAKVKCWIGKHAFCRDINTSGKFCNENLLT